MLPKKGNGGLGFTVGAGIWIKIRRVSLVFNNLQIGLDCFGHFIVTIIFAVRMNLEQVWAHNLIET